MIYSTPLGTAKPLITFPSIFPNKKTRKNFYLTLKPTKRLQFNSRPRVFLPKASSNSVPSVNSGAQDEDFVTRVLRENPSQVEPRRLIGNKLYTLKEKEEFSRGGFYEKVSELLKRLNLKALGRTDKDIDNESDFVKPEGEIYLKDLLREHKGKLYVPEKVFMPKLSEEEKFDKVVKELPIMKYEDFQEYLNYDKVKLVTFKEDSRLSLYRDFVVDLKEIPGEKSLHRTKWAMRLNNEQAQDLLEAYKGPLNEIENQIESQMMSRVGKVPEFPPPAASKLSSRMIIEFGVVAAAIASTSIITLASLASILLYAMTYSFEVVEKVIWPSAIEPVLKLSWGLIEGFFQKVGENLLEFASASAEGGGPLSQVSEFIYSLGGIFSGIGVLKPVMVITLMMVCAIRFTIARKPKNFKKWDIWQGIEFSQSKAQARVDGSTGVKFSDVAGIDDAVEELQELVRYLKNPKLFDQLGIKPPHGVLLEGPPGCGKTLVAKAIAGEAGVPFYQMAGSEFVEILVGVGSARVRDLFKRAKINKPSVIFIDEIDALGTRRQTKFPDKMDTKYNSAVQERETTLNQLLIELDGFDTGKGVIFLGATNRRDLLDPALLRPGRFDRKIRIRPPNAKGREDILKVHARKVKLSDSVDLATYANNLPGWTGAKLAQLLQEAALIAVRKGHTAILPSDMDNAVDRLTVGPRRVGMYLNHYGQCRRATAEMGTAFTSQLLRRFENAIVEPCARVSIHPHGETLSQLVFNRLKDESAYTYERKPQLLHRLQVFLGARAAEEVIFGRDTSKASVSYLASASWLARKIITIWNMENPMVLHAQPPPWRKWIKAIGPRIDFEGSLYKSSRIVEPPINISMGDDIAIRTEALMQDMYKKTVDLLRHHNAALLKAVKVLIDQREISGDEIDFIIENYPPQTPASIVLEERNPGSLPFFEEKQEQSNEVEYTLLSS